MAAPAATLRLALLLLAVTQLAIAVSAADNSSSVVASRTPRVMGRIVKLYTHARQAGFRCAGAGFHADPDNCAVFYRCVESGGDKFITFKFQCGPGTVYDPESGVCNFPSSTRRTECGGNAQLPAVSNEGSSENEIDSDESNQPPPSPIATKDLKEFAKTTARAQPTSTAAPWSSSTRQQTTVMRKLEHTNKQATATEDSSINNDQCTTDGFMGDSKNCRKFYRCVANGRGGFIRYEFSCSETTVWDDNVQACNHAWAARSQSCGRGKKNDDQKKETVQETTASSLNEKQSQTQINKGSHSSQKQTQINYGDRIKQDQYQLNNGSHSSQIQTQINEKTDASSQSQKQINSGDHNTQIQTQINHSKQSSQTQTQSNNNPSTTTTQSYYQPDDQYQNNESDASPTQSSTNSDNNSNNKCTSSGFMGDSNDCKKFYRCVDNGRGSYTRYEFTCGEGTVWDSNAEACNHAWAVEKCGGNSKDDIEKIEQITSATISTKGTTSKPNQMVQSTTEGIDEEDQGYGQQSQTDETKPTSASVTTTKPTSAKPIMGNDNKCSSSGFMGNTADCKKFYRCVENGRGSYTRYEFSCGEGTVWDQNIEACNHAWAVKECGGKPTSDSDEVESTTEFVSQKPNKQTTQPPFIETTLEIEDKDQGYGSGRPTETSMTTKTTTQRSESSSQECSNEGFMGDSQDCKKFYRCVDNGRGGYIKYEFTCGEGTVWDQEVQACNHESMVKNCGSGSTKPSGPTENEVDSGYGPEPVHDEPQESVTSRPDVTEQTAASETTTDSMNTPMSKDQCSAEGFYPDSNDCKKFYRCVDNGRGGYTKYDFTCGEGTIWDQEIQACNHPTGDNKCSKGTSPTNKPTLSDNITPAQQEQSTTHSEQSPTEQDHSTQPTTRKPIQSDEKCSSDGFFGDKNDCKKFYRCVDNGKGGYTKYEFSCGDGTVWDQEIQGCNFESSSRKCGQSVESSSTTQKNQTPRPSDEHTTERMEDEYVTPDQGNEGSPSNKPSSDAGPDGKCTSEGFYANKNNCKKFYRCVDNGRGGYTRYDFDCGEGTAWDQEAQTCNYEDSVDCSGTNQGEHEQTPQSPPPNEQQSETTEKTPSESSTSEYGSTSKQPTSNGKCEQEGYFGNPNDCKKFYRCVDNGNGGLTKYDFDCGEGTIWDQDLTTCNHPSDVQNPSCTRDGTQSSTTLSPSQTTQQSTAKTTTTTESSSSGTEQSSSSTQSEPASKPTSSNITCPEAGFYANPDDCKKFYRCVDYEGDGKSYTVFHFDCGEGTIWDPNLDTCNYEDSIYPPRDCSKQTQGQEIDSTKAPESTTDSSTESTTTQKSTTEKQTTTESTTTQESTTQEQSIQEQTTAATTQQQPTTQGESTTEQETTTKQSTTTESTTTQQTTTQQETTTQSQTTTTQKQSTTTQQETTTQETTTQQSTTTQEETTTQESTTSQATTQDDTTTQSSTTESQTTEQETTEQQTESQTESTTEQSTTESSTEESGSTESSSSDKKCPETEDDQNLYVCPTGFRRHPKYCNLFYQCTEDDSNHDVKIAVFHCQNNTIYDESKTQCVEESQADKKCEGERAERRRFKRLDDNSKPPISVAKNSLRCPNEGHFPFDKKDSCSPAFLKCQRSIATQKMRGFIYRCPEGFVYWAVSRRCERLSKMRECKEADKTWKGRWEIPMEKSNLAP